MIALPAKTRQQACVSSSPVIVPKVMTDSILNVSLLLVIEFNVPSGVFGFHPVDPICFLGWFGLLRHERRPRTIESAGTNGMALKYLHLL